MQELLSGVLRSSEDSGGSDGGGRRKSGRWGSLSRHKEPLGGKRSVEGAGWEVSGQQGGKACCRPGGGQGRGCCVCFPYHQTVHVNSEAEARKPSLGPGAHTPRPEQCGFSPCGCVWCALFLSSVTTSYCPRILVCSSREI